MVDDTDREAMGKSWEACMWRKVEDPYDGPAVNLAEYAFRCGWLAALAHYAPRLRELAEAVEGIDHSVLGDQPSTLNREIRNHIEAAQSLATTILNEQEQDDA